MKKLKNCDCCNISKTLTMKNEFSKFCYRAEKMQNSFQQSFFNIGKFLFINQCSIILQTDCCTDVKLFCKVKRKVDILIWYERKFFFRRNLHFHWSRKYLEQNVHRNPTNKIMFVQNWVTTYLQELSDLKGQVHQCKVRSKWR